MSGTQNQPSSTRLLQLDALRGFAALGVVLWHLIHYFNEHFGGHIPGLWISFERGFYGVNLFFSISGFVILMTLTRCHSVTEFFIKRFARLYPLFITSVILTWGTVAIFGLPNKEVNLVNGILNLTMLPKTLGFPMVDGVYWTLEVELLFYLWCGLLFKLDLIKHMVIIILVHLCFFFVIIYLERNYGLGFNTDKLHLLLISGYFYQFIFGILIYLLHVKKIEWKTFLFLSALAFGYGLYHRESLSYSFYLNLAILF